MFSNCKLIIFSVFKLYEWIKNLSRYQNFHNFVESHQIIAVRGPRSYQILRLKMLVYTIFAIGSLKLFFIFNYVELFYKVISIIFLQTDLVYG